jgi:hypothetical protein
MHRTNKQFLPTTGGPPNASLRELLPHRKVDGEDRVAVERVK